MKAAGHRDGPARFEPSVFGITTITRLAQTAAGDQHRVAFPEAAIARCHDVAGDIDATHEREPAQDPALAGSGKRILEVDRRVGGPDDDLAGREALEGNLLDAAAITIVVAVDAECGECTRDGGCIHDQYR